MKRSVLAALLAFIIACGTLAGTSSIVLADTTKAGAAPTDLTDIPTPLQQSITYALELKKTPNYENLIPSVRQLFDSTLEKAQAMEDDPNASAVEKALMATELSQVCNLFNFVKGDKTELQAYYDEVKDLDLDLYVDGKEKDDFIAALQTAFDVLESEESIQKDVDDAKTALESARDALIEKQQEVDKSALQEAIRDAEAVDLNGYISTGQDAFTDALAHAKDVFENPDATQAEVDKAAEELKAAQNSLVAKADKTELEEAIQNAEKVDTDDFISTGKQEFIDKLEAAKDVLANEDATQAEVDKAAEELKAAQDGLVAKADKTELEEAIQNAEKVDTDDFTSTGKQEFIDKLEVAKEVLANEDATQAEVDKAAEELKAAQDGLVAKADKTELEEAIQNAEKVDTDDFISTGKQEFIDKLEAAKDVLANEDATQAEVDKAAEELKAAQDGLVAKADKTELEEAIQNAEKVDTDDFTSTGKQEFIDKLEVAKEVLANEDATQAEVDKAAEELKAAQDSLVAKADKTKLDEAIKNAENLTSQDFDTAGTEAYKEFIFALSEAKKVQADPDATQQQVDDATQRLIDAAKAANKQADKSELEEAIKEAESLTPKTDELDKAIEEAKKVLDDKTLTNMDQAVVDKATEDLKAAIEAWKKAHPDQEKPTPEDPDKKDDDKKKDDNKTNNTKTGEASTAAAGILLAAGCAAVLTRKRKIK